VIQLRHRQPSLWHSGLAKDIEDLWEPWMKEVDQLLEDAALVESVYDAQGKRHPNSRTRGRAQTPAEVALGLLILKHVRNWSYDTLEREVRANLVYRAFEVFAERPEDSRLLVPAVEQHQRRFGRAPRMVAADTGFYSLKNEKTIQEMGVTRVAVPSRSTKSSERRKLQRTRWFRAGQRWRTGCEGRISVLKRRHGLNRCRYRGFEGMQRWVGLGVIADNLIQIGRCLAVQRT
jgi:Transposase DDE domain